MKTLDEMVKDVIGNHTMQILMLQYQLNEANAKIVKLEAQIPRDNEDSKKGNPSNLRAVNE